MQYNIDRSYTNSVCWVNYAPSFANFLRIMSAKIMKLVDIRRPNVKVMSEDKTGFLPRDALVHSAVMLQ